MKTTITIFLSVLCIIEFLIICIFAYKTKADRLQESNNDNKINTLYDRITAMDKTIQITSEQRDKWHSAFQKEKKLSDHRARRIESIYRGQIIKANKEKNGVKDNIS